MQIYLTLLNSIRIKLVKCTLYVFYHPFKKLLPMISNRTSFTQLLGVGNPKGTEYKSARIWSLTVTPISAEEDDPIDSKGQKNTEA